MRVIVVGAEGLLGTELLASLSTGKEVSTVVSLVDHPTADRLSGADTGVVEEVVDLTADLTEHFRFADAVVSAGWPICGFEDPDAGCRYLDVLGRTTEGILAANVPAGVFVSSAWAGARADGRSDALQPASAAAGRLMAEGERLLDDFEKVQSIVRVVRLKCAWVAGAPRPLGDAASHLRRRLVHVLLGGTRARFVANLGEGGIQAVHVEDLGQAVRLALSGPVVGHFELAAPPITTELMARVFAARPVPVPLNSVVKLLTRFRRPKMHSAVAIRLDLSLHTPPVDATAAAEVMAWHLKHPAPSILEGWVASVVGGGPRIASTEASSTGPEGGISRVSRAPSEDPPGPSRRAAYQEALEQFGNLVHAVTNDQWSMRTEYQGWTVWQLVAEAARSQYRLARCLAGERPAEVETQLPGDPLGFEKADGWDIAAEKGRMALERPSPTSGGAADRFLTGASCQLAVLGWYLGRAIGHEAQAGPELLLLVDAELYPLSSA